MSYTAHQCPENCPGCGFQKYSYQDTIEKKYGFLQTELHEFAEYLQEIIVSRQTTAYRNKVMLHASYCNDKWLLGLKKRDEVIDIRHCALHADIVTQSIENIIEKLPPFSIFHLKYYVQIGKQIIFVIKSNQMPEMQWLDSQLINALKDIGIEGIWIHLHPSAGNKVFGKPGWHLVWGQPFSYDEQGFAYGAMSFQQLISELYDISIQKALQFLQLKTGIVLIDMYSGLGISSHSFTQNGARVLGVELNGEAVNLAKENAKDAVFLRGTCAQRLPQVDEFLARQNCQHFMLYVNPPRTGIESEVLSWILKSKPSKMVYMSCNPKSLYRDTAHLSSIYDMVEIIPFDFFPFTRHVESLAFLKLKT